METPQDESEAAEELDAMLADFERTTKTDDLNPGEIFRGVLDSTPGLKAQFLLAVEKGHLAAIKAEPDPRFNGSYNPVDRTMRLSVDQLSDADPNQPPEDVRDGINFVRYTAGHEIDHALSRNESLQLGQRFREQAAAIANTPSPHDFTAPVKAYNEGARAIEARAEIAGFNTVASQLKQENPRAKLANLFEADGGASNHTNHDRKTPPSYVPKSGFHIKPDLQMDADKSLEAMAKDFYDANAGYPARNIDWAFGEIYRQEAIAQAAHPGRAFPEIRIDVEALGAKVTLPLDFKDTSRTPPDKPAPSPERPTAPGANDPGHPDHTLLEKIRSGVRDLERGMGKPWDDQSERLSASALSLAVAHRFGPGDDVKVALSRASGQNAAGDTLFVYRDGRGASPDLAANFAHMPVSQALSLPASERYEQAQALREAQAMQQRAAQETAQQIQGADAQSQTGPRI